MRKTSLSVLTVSMCVALSLSSFALPTFASSNLKTDQGKVMEKEVPNKYMVDFFSNGVSDAERTLFLTENQIKLLASTAEKAYKEKFGIDIPKDFTFEYTAERDYNWPENESAYINLSWSNNKNTADISKKVYLSASFTSTNFPEKGAVLDSVFCTNAFDSNRFETVEKEAKKSLKEQLNMTVPEAYVKNISLSASFNESKQDTKLEIFWADKKLEEARAKGENISLFDVYGVGFDKFDLTKNSGRLTRVEKSYEFTQQSVKEMIAQPGYKDYGDEQKNKMLDAAKNFLTAKNIKFGNLRRNIKINYGKGTAFYLTFDATDINDSNTGSVAITITPELEILGYMY